MRKLCRTLTVAIFAAILTAGTLTFADADARSISYDLNIPSEDLTAALQSFAIASHHKLLYKADLTAGKISRALKGHFTVQEAMEALLSGTGLSYEITGSSVVLIKDQRDGKTSDLREEGGPSSPNPSHQSSGGQPLVLGQANPPTSVPNDSTTKDNQNVPEKESKAQSSSDEEKSGISEIVVTGTHIGGGGNPTAPVIVIDRVDIERSGYTTTQELVASIPQNFGGGSTNATADGPLGSGSLGGINDSYATGINLRGLGTSSTLVLVNGQRLASSAVGLFVDVSVIPLAAIERVEIMTDGASAIYGADAVAGVVNFITRKDYQGQESWVNYGSGTDGTLHQETIGQSIGRNWSGGNVFAALQYQDTQALSAADRSYTASTPEPTTLLPASRQYSAVINVRQDLPSGFDLSSNVLYSRTARSGSTAEPGQLTFEWPVANAGVATVTLGYRPTDRWRIQATASYSLTDTTFPREYVPQSQPECGNGPCQYHDNYKEGSADLVADGTLFHAPGGEAKVAVGASYRNEAFTDILVQNPPDDVRFDRHVTAEFVELKLPIVGAINAQPLLKEVDVSLAVRRDDYSDFGATTNPRYGLSWKPVDWLHIRGAYSTSFRAPNAFEENDLGLAPLVIELPWPSPSGPSGSTVPVFDQLFNPDVKLEPETSRNVTAGLEFSPPALPNFKASIDYFDIHYRDLIVRPNIQANALSQLNVYGSLITPIPNDAAAQAYINKIQSAGGSYYDFTCGPDGVTGCSGATGVRYLFNNYVQNVALETVSGLDINASDRFRMGDSEFHVGLNAAYIAHLDTSYTATSAPTNLINTYANPLHWRARGQLGWSRGPWSVNTSANFSGSYVDTTTLPFASIASWTTVDAQLAYAPSFVNNLKLSLSCTNIFNRDPPYVVGSNQFNGTIHYDVGNGNPLGRVVVLSARFGW